MKVEKRGGVGGLGPAKRPRQSAGGFALPDTMSSAESSAAAPLSPTASLAPLLALQEVDADDGRRRQALSHGRALLDGLDALRLDLMMGRVPRARLEQLMILVRGRRERIADPQLAALLDDIELRAAVELAKLGF